MASDLFWSKSVRHIQLSESCPQARQAVWVLRFVNISDYRARATVEKRSYLFGKLEHAWKTKKGRTLFDCDSEVQSFQRFAVRPDGFFLALRTELSYFSAPCSVRSRNMLPSGIIRSVFSLIVQAITALLSASNSLLLTHIFRPNWYFAGGRAELSRPGGDIKTGLRDVVFESWAK